MDPSRQGRLGLLSTIDLAGILAWGVA